jgi:hypothetical protein
MVKRPTKQEGGKLPVTGTQCDKSKAVRKRIAKLAESKFKAGPPKSKVKDQSSKVIPRGSLRSSAKQTGAADLRSGRPKRMSYNATM